MKICIYGVGAIGGLFAAKLAAQGHDVSAIARGETREALIQKGIGLIYQGQTQYHCIRVAKNPDELGPQDLVVIAVKQPSLYDVAKAIKPLLAAHTKVLVAMNGVPWWFFDGMKGEMTEATLKCIDPRGDMRSLIPTQNVVGCVVHISCTTPDAGVCLHRFGNVLIIGDPLHKPVHKSKKLQAIADVLVQSGFKVQASDFIQHDIWFKLWGNMTMNPVSALTGATTDRILDDDLVKGFCSAVMNEALEVGKAIGCHIEQTAEQRHAITRELGAMKTSMLQDVQAKRVLEIDALLTVVCEIAKRTRVAVPHMNALLGLSRLFAQMHGLYKAQ